MFRRLAVALAATFALVATAPAISAAQPATTPAAYAAKSAPNVHCLRLDKAKKKLYMAGFNVKVKGGGLLGVINDAGWVVTSQSTSGNTVTVYAGRSC